MDLYQTEIVVGGILVLVLILGALVKCVRGDSDD